MDTQTMMMIIVVQIVFWGSLVGIIYIFISARNKERLALINKGVDASIFKMDKTERRLDALKWGLVIVAVGIGVFAGSIMTETRILDQGPAFVSMPLIFGGLGLLTYYFLVKNNKED